MVTIATQPLKTWDARTLENYPGQSIEWLDAFHAWVEAHGIDIRRTFRIEYYLIDAPFVRVYQEAIDAAGHRYIDPATDNIALREPFDIVVTTPPPEPEPHPDTTTPADTR